MKRTAFYRLASILLSISAVRAQDVNNPWPKDPYLANNRPPDARYKADLLVVVAHPDDEIMAAAYVAREIDEGKRVAIVWTTRGDGGTNDVGPEQATAMGDIREVEGMRGAASLGITNMWNLGGPDTPTQDPLESLETCNHARCLDRLVRIVRLTRPDVILTWLPLGVTGENHGDHQASGVLATEAFDMAGDPTVFPEQVTPAGEPKRNQNRLEGLRPWQPQKIYYFSNPTHMDFFTAQGPAIFRSRSFSQAPYPLRPDRRSGVHLSSDARRRPSRAGASRTRRRRAGTSHPADETQQVHLGQISRSIVHHG